MTSKGLPVACCVLICSRGVAQPQHIPKQHWGVFGFFKEEAWGWGKGLARGAIDPRHCVRMRQWNGPSRGMKRKQMGMRMSTLSGVFLVLLFLSVTGYVWRVEVPGLHGKFVQDAEAGSVPLSPKRILLATHTKLLWYDYEADVAEELSSGLVRMK